MSVDVLLFTEISAPNVNYGRSAGAYVIASAIRKAGHSCQVVDFFTKFSQSEIEHIIDSTIGANTLIVGFSSTFFQNREPMSPSKFTPAYPLNDITMHGWFMRIKSINPKVKIVFGGAKAEFIQAEADVFVHGYSDQAIVEYLAFLQGKNPFFQYNNINDHQIEIYGADFTGKFEFTTSSLEWHQSDHLQFNETVPIEISRGCIFKCHFCSYPLNGKKKLDFVKDENTLREEFIRNYNDYGITRYIYADDTHNDSVEKLQMMHRIVTTLPFEIEYSTYLRIDLLYAHKETAKMMRESGLRATFFGVESLNYESAKAIGKGIHPDKIKETIHWLREDIWKDEVSMTAGFIVGLPHETPDTVANWTQWILNDNCPLHRAQFTGLGIDRNAKTWQSEFSKNADKYGYTFDEHGWKNEYFTAATASALARQLTLSALPYSDAASNFRLMMLGNFGFTPRDTITVKTPLDIAPRRIAYMNAYKQRLLAALTINT